jgi:addiction module HigA family antidote
MHHPPHPGEVLKGLFLDPLGLSITQTARDLGVSRVALSEIVNGRRGISPEMAIRLASAFKTEVKMWLNLQTNYELWQIESRVNDIKSQVRAIIPDGNALA